MATKKNSLQDISDCYCSLQLCCDLLSENDYFFLKNVIEVIVNVLPYLHENALFKCHRCGPKLDITKVSQNIA